VFDISDVLETKIAAVKCYRTQFPPEKDYIYERLQAMAGVCGLSAGFKFGEVLTSTHVLGSRDLMKTLLLS
jgi:LmbE family N-acetylglucosaminyl deacetylase